MSTYKNIIDQRDVKLDFLRLLAILECIVSHALVAEQSLSEPELHWIIMFFPDTAAIFFMASGALILERPQRCDWRYVWHRIWSFLPEFVIFSVLYLILDQYYGFGPTERSVSTQLMYMFVTPTWGPGWFILALIGLYFVTPFLWAWIQTATKRQIEIAIAIWLCSTTLPFVMTQTPVTIENSPFGTIFNFAGYMIVGYYLRRWAFKKRSTIFKTAFFMITFGVGVIFGYFLGRNGVKWDYVFVLTSGLSITVTMVSLLQYGLVLSLPDKWFTNRGGRCIVKISMLSLGIYCWHWLFIHYWAVPENVNWILSSVLTFAVCIPLAYASRYIRRLLTPER